ncbi:MAG: CotH kinase family protein [Firmicutes bacterium]|nr:CotH kinase family protein [Bacillota bacterium]
MKKNKRLIAACIILAVIIIATVAINLLGGGVINELNQTVAEPQPFSPETIAALADEGELTLAFSETEAFHRTGIAIDIIASNPNARIYYTRDGSFPTTQSSLFTTPLRFLPAGPASAVVLRAIAVYGDQVSAPLTQTFFMGLNIETRFDTLVFSISTNPDYLFCHYNGIFVPGIIREEFIRDNPGHYVIPPDPANFNLRGHEAERPGYMEVFSSCGERIFSQSTGIRTHGGWSRAAEQKSIRLIARDEYSPGFGQFHFDFFPWDFAHDGSPIDRYDTLILRNGGNGRNHDMMRHEVGSILARNAGFTAVSPVRPAAVFLNGLYYGFAWLQVRFNEQYMERLFNTPTRNFDIVGMGERWIDTDDQRIRQDLYHKNSFANKNLLDDDIFTEFEALVDIDNMLFYYAFQIFMGNEDWPHNNLRRWRYTGPELGLTPETDGRWRYIFFDLDWTLGLYGDDYTKPTFYRVVSSNEPRSPLLANVLTRPDMQQRFREIMHHIAEEVVTEHTVTQAINYLHSIFINEFTHAFRAGKYAHWFNIGFMEYNHRNMINFARFRYRQIFADMDAFFRH